MYCWTFPKYQGEIESVSKQINKIGFEFMELLETNSGPTYNAQDVAEECMDVIHACETLLRHLKKVHKLDVDHVASRVYEKNRDRGYYNEPAISEKAKETWAKRWSDYEKEARRIANEDYKRIYDKAKLESKKLNPKKKIGYAILDSTIVVKPPETSVVFKNYGHDYDGDYCYKQIKDLSDVYKW